MDKSKEELIRDKNIEFAKAFASKSKVDGEILKAFEKLYDGKNKRKVTVDQIQTYIENPYANADKLQDAISYMVNMNGIVKSMLMYLSKMLTYDHYLLCSDISKYKDKTKFDNAYRKAVLELKKYTIKFNSSWMLNRLIRDGEVYSYLLENDEGITIRPMPNSLCKITSARSGLQNYSINLDALTDDTILAYPDEVQKLYKKKKSGALKNDKQYKDGFYPLDKSKAFAFSIEYSIPKNVPYFTGVLRNLCRLCNMEDMDESNAELSNFKLIQMVIPFNKDTGEILVEADEAIQYFNDTERQLPDRMGFVALPYNLESVNLGDISSREIDYIDKLKKSTYDAAGINDELFNGTKNNNQSVIFSQILDSLLPLDLIEQFRLFFNEVFKTNSALKNFELVYVDSTRFNKDEKIKLAVGNAGMYNSKLALMAYQGLEPHQSYNVLKQEELMGLSDLMKPMESAHTSSGKDNGRPSANKDDSNKAPLAQN